MFFRKRPGFTMAQLIIGMTIFLLMGAMVFIWIDPLAKIGETKNKKRTQDVNVIVAALHNYAKEHEGVMPVLGAITTSKKVLCSTQSGTELTCDGDTELCLTIDDDDFYKYLRELPYDPDKSSAEDTGYYLYKDSSENLIVGACSTYNSEDVSTYVGLRDACVSGSESGVHAGGNCWYKGFVSGVDCDLLCGNLNLDCVKNAQYGPDVDSGGSYFCRLNKDISGNACASGCTLAATGTPPTLSANACTVQKGSVICSQSPGSASAFCPCK